MQDVYTTESNVGADSELIVHRQSYFVGAIGDTRALLNAGLLDKTEDGCIVFPFDAVRVDFTLRAA
jgi:hypothetical protein